MLINCNFTPRALRNELIKPETCQDQAFQRALAVHQVKEEGELQIGSILSLEHFIAALAGSGGASLSEKRKAARRARNRKKTSQGSQAVSLLMDPR